MGRTGKETKSRGPAADFRQLAVGTARTEHAPIHIKQNSMMQNIISKFVHLKGDEEDMVLSGSEMKNAGVSLAPSFGGTGYEDGMRLFTDYSSRLYFIEKI